MKPSIGVIGVGLMGHGIARNILKHGYKLTLMEHPGNRPLDELLSLGAAPRATAAEVARDADVVILCVTGTPQVEEVLTSENGVLAGLRPGAVVVDSVVETVGCVRPNVRSELGVTYVYTFVDHTNNYAGSRRCRPR